MPVTNHEVFFGDDEFMLTKTDLKGIITYVNQDFIKMSGYSEEELLGASHNIVRHPDMPVEAFADLWVQLKAGRPWTGLVKNRTKSGDFYWVEANATPIFENGQITSYLSARRKPTREQVEGADAAYRLFKEGKAKGLRIVEGKGVHDTLGYKLKTWLQNFKVINRLFTMVAVDVLIATSLIVYSLNALEHANTNLKAVYDNRMLPVKDLYAIETLRENNFTQLSSAINRASHVREGKEVAPVMNAEVAAKAADTMEGNIKSIDTLMDGYMTSNFSPEEKILATTYKEARDKFDAGMSRIGIVALRANNYAEAQKIYSQAAPLRENASQAAGALVKLQFEMANNSYQAAVKTYETVRIIAIGGLLLAISLMVGLGLFIARTITNPLKQAIHVFKLIAANELNYSINAVGNNEMGDVLRALKTMQTMLNVNVNEQKDLSKKIEATSIKYEGQLSSIAKSSCVMEFSMDGKVFAANDVLLKAIGYSLNEVMGQPHSTFVTSTTANSDEYKQFWNKLGNGEAITGEFCFVGKGGKESWLQASYNPILDETGKPYKVVLYATDVTEDKLKNASFEGQIEAIGKSQGIVAFNLDGKVTAVNDNFATLTAYSPKEVIGQHHSMFVDAAYKASPEYQSFWAKLGCGEAISGDYKCIGKGGKEFWLQTSFNPIMDSNGKPFQMVQYATDITAQKNADEANKKAFAFASLIKTSLDNASVNMMMADNDGVILYMSASAERLMRSSISEFKKALPQFDPNKIVGRSFDIFHKNPSHQRSLLASLTQAYVATVPVGGLIFKLTASPIINEEGTRLGTALEWLDITAERNVENEIANIVEEATKGDLSNRIPLEGKSGSVSALCDGVNAIMNKMAEIITQVREAGETINTAAGEISTGNTDLSVRTEQQASSLEKTASSMEELASTVKQNSENAKQANQLAASASTVAVRGGQVVGQVVSTMGAINASAKKIEDIISVIDGIAFQTNILALNAAVEAARAGEQGRGFAVVAGEVRNLAQRSAAAAKEIKGLITDSVNKTAEGTIQVENAGKTMQEIVSSVQRVTDIMSEIAAASIEQSAGIDQVNEAITSMDEATQQNAALVEQAAAAAESLVEQSNSLMDTVSAFKLNGGNNVSLIAHKTPSRPIASRPATRPAAGPVAKSAPVKVAAKTTTGDGGWEEF
ncbi:MAG: methyl-accepting chemotaxis protein [Methylotenera sp.]|uniref:methyl-accepting chemotaxis protein n=1 Tax=Methylotenera sp. TaxID=2051956 RepID=UPI00248A65C7|nr:methyl-accepting chemotaxis protein [Methylotenera sp.]MDI1308424.1 methyl-accepting chemotaxis protein [Methylotenera sp.]